MRSSPTSPRAFGMLLCLTLLFIAGQLAFSFAHYQATQLIDVLASHSIVQQMQHPVIWLPIVYFMVSQLVAYFLFAAGIWFICESVARWFAWAAVTTYWFTIVCWLLGAFTLLALNRYYFPHSFFAQIFIAHPVIDALSVVIALITLLLFLTLTLITLLQNLKRAGCFLLLGLLLGGFSLFEKMQPQFVATAHTQPNVIIIGLDSLRPDFIGKNTPHVNGFLQTAAQFTEAYTPLARTFPAWISILTAQYPKHNGARNNLIDPNSLRIEETLVTRLQQAGYETVYATDENRFSNITTAYGFDKVLGPKMGVNDFLLGSLADFPLSNLLVNLPLGRWLLPYAHANRAASVTYEPDTFLAYLKGELAQLGQKPLFLSIHLCLAHWPFTYANDRETTDLSMPLRYQQSVAAVDVQFKKLLRLLQDAHLLDHSIVVVLSDHGTSLGLRGDRIITEKKYQGEAQLLKRIAVARFSKAKEYSSDFKRDYSISTAYGQGTDVLSMKQHHVLLAFKGYGMSLPTKKINMMSSLIDIAPTLLSLLQLPALQKADGHVLLPERHDKNNRKYFFMETGDSLREIETDHIQVEKVLQREIDIYQINPKTGLLSMRKEAALSLISNKQHAVMNDDWLLAHYPMKIQTKLEALPHQPKQLVITPYVVPPYFVLVNRKTREWTIGLTTHFAKSAPVTLLLAAYRQFYGEEG